MNLQLQPTSVELQMDFGEEYLYAMDIGIVVKRQKERYGSRETSSEDNEN